MKKCFLILALIFGFAISMSAQTHYIGEYYPINGIPARIIYLDETGEHGFVVSEQRCYLFNDVKDKEKKKVKFFNDAVKHHYITEEMAEIYKSRPSEKISLKKKDNKISRAAWSAFTSSNGDYGEDNMRIAKDICNEHSLSLALYFPTFYWAEWLGDGWFIPGNHELKLIAKSLYGYSVGDSFDLKGNTIEKGKVFQAYAMAATGSSEMEASSYYEKVKQLFPEVEHSAKIVTDVLHKSPADLKYSSYYGHRVHMPVGLMSSTHGMFLAMTKKYIVGAVHPDSKVNVMLCPIEYTFVPMIGAVLKSEYRCLFNPYILADIFPMGDKNHPLEAFISTCAIHRF